VDCRGLMMINVNRKLRLPRPFPLFPAADGVVNAGPAPDAACSSG